MRGLRHSPPRHGALRDGALPLVLVGGVAVTHAEDADDEDDDAEDEQRRSGHLEWVIANGRVARPVGDDRHDETDEEETEGQHQHNDDHRLDAGRASRHGASRQVALSVL